MSNFFNGCRVWAALLVALGLTSHALAADVKPPALMNEAVLLVPKPGTFGVELETTVFRPDGDGPFPVALINHGKAPGDPLFQERARYTVAAREFVRRGYAVVVPMRQGFAGSTGRYVDGGCNIAGNARYQADDLEAVIGWLRKQPWADTTRMVVIGQSHGGLTTLAFGTRETPGVRALINFAGGLRQNSCQWETDLVSAFGSFGGRARTPSLWFYGENDSYFGPDLVSRLYDAYTKAGGKAKLVAYGPFKNDAHGMFGSRDGVPIWLPEVERFLQEAGLPTAVRVAVGEMPRPPASGFAAIEDAQALPFVRDAGRKGYRAFLDKGVPRAFAISPTGAWGWAAEGDDPAARAVANCQRNSKEPCRLYAVDDEVVWTARAPQ